MNRVERDRYIAWVGLTYSDVQIWGQYDRLIDFIYKEYPKTKQRFEQIAFPILSVLSHGIELALKENIKFFREYHESPHLTKFENWILLMKSHDLKDLAFEFKAGYTKLHRKVKAEKEYLTEFSKYYKKLEELIKILNRSTETYRYSFKIDNKGNIIKRSIDDSVIIDFYYVKELFEDVKILFLGAPNSLGIYTDYIDYKKGNPEYKKGKGYLYCQRLYYTEHFLEEIKKKLSQDLHSLPNDIWLDKKTGENFEVKVWESHIYIIAI